MNAVCFTHANTTPMGEIQQANTSSVSVMGALEWSSQSTTKIKLQYCLHPWGVFVVDSGHALSLVPDVSAVDLAYNFNFLHKLAYEMVKIHWIFSKSDI